MNSFIETLNQWGVNFLNFAWPMLWQSSLLIALVLALDFWLARKIRGSIRYALWLAVLVKLLLPPTLALPTSAAWWLFKSQPAVKAPAAKKYVITYDSVAPQAYFVPQTFPVRAPEPELDVAGGALLVSATVSAGLMLWLALRWRQVMRKVRNAPVSRESAGPLEAAQQMIGSGSRVRLKIVDGQMSPAVCGLFNPVILLPRTLAEKLSAGQLRAVLLHELFHLRRRDVWVNCAQALLQIVYWWHPLLWLANARIRRVREEAVDDAVMLALREEAEDYAPTLLEVARLAFHRPRLSLGLVGIMESRSALRQRIERLVNFHAPRKAGLSFLSFCCIFAFSAVALPMGEAPASAPDEFSAAATSAGKTLTMKVNPEVFLRNVKAQANWRLDAPTDDSTKILLDILRGETVDCSPPHGIALNMKTGEITTQNTPEQLEIFSQVIKQLNRPDGLYEMPPIPRRFVVIEARCFWMGLDDREKLVADLQSERGKNEGTPHWIISPEQFDEVNQRLTSLNLHPFLRPRIQTLHGMAAEFFVGNKTNGLEFNCVPFAADKGLGNGRKGIALVFRTETVGNPTGLEQKLTGTSHYKASGEVGVEDRGGFVVSAVNPDGSPTNVVMVIGVQVVTNIIRPAIRPSARSNQPQIHIKARFLGVPKGTLDGFGKIIGSTNSPEQLVGILTSENAKAAIKALESRAGVEELAEPEVTTTSGRQTQMRATQILTVITNFVLKENFDNPVSAITPQSTKMEFGPVLDVIPTVLPDGYTIDMRTTASLTEFLGYATPPTKPAEHINNLGDHVPVTLPVILPSFDVRTARAHVNLYDGQTLLLGKFKTEAVGAENVPKLGPRELLVFVTVTLVDTAGNRIHSDDDPLLTKEAIPQQEGIR